MKVPVKALTNQVGRNCRMLKPTPTWDSLRNMTTKQAQPITLPVLNNISQVILRVIGYGLLLGKESQKLSTETSAETAGGTA